MQKQNVTLSLPRNLLREAKILAVERDTSLSSLLASALADLIGRDKRFSAARHLHLTVLEEGLDLGLNDRTSWKRDDLYD